MKPETNGEKPRLISDEEAGKLKQLFDTKIESDDDLIALAEIFEEDE